MCFIQFSSVGKHALHDCLADLEVLETSCELLVALEIKSEGRTEDPSAEERTGRKPVAYSAAASVNI